MRFDLSAQLHVRVNSNVTHGVDVELDLLQRLLPLLQEGVSGLLAEFGKRTADLLILGISKLLVVSDFNLDLVVLFGVLLDVFDVVVGLVVLGELNTHNSVANFGEGRH